jgi:hypothetical protein
MIHERMGSAMLSMLLIRWYFISLTKPERGRERGSPHWAVAGTSPNILNPWRRTLPFALIHDDVAKRTRVTHGLGAMFVDLCHSPTTLSHAMAQGVLTQRQTSQNRLFMIVSRVTASLKTRQSVFNVSKQHARTLTSSQDASRDLWPDLIHVTNLLPL